MIEIDERALERLVGQGEGPVGESVLQPTAPGTPS
ncbi:hypothetical protein SAMN05216377_12633 [Pseudonocardia oroxyli]|uniref:Uncharacterized protein n=1 Tax=Pseudonocardia oroxyli TaxID=366584 RepID=A0A1G8DH65_PSEOR|nr:hypothetical protein SAMN05216377_12633 [Pseudonocardia oroxyli]